MHLGWIAIGIAAVTLLVQAKRADASNPPDVPSQGGETDIWNLFIKNADIGSITPVTAFSIWQWETGHGSSRQWKIGHNPGGLTYHPEIAIVGHTFGSLESSEENPASRTKAMFPSDDEGTKALYRWFLQPRYKAARDAASHIREVQAIFDAGYAEDPAWLAGVTSLVQKNEQV